MINKFEKDGLYFIALGGADEIGMNMYVYACNGKFIMVDAGYGFLNDNYPGIDLCFADAGFFANYAEDFHHPCPRGPFRRRRPGMAAAEMSGLRQRIYSRADQKPVARI